MIIKANIYLHCITAALSILLNFCTMHGTVSFQIVDFLYLVHERRAHFHFDPFKGFLTEQARLPLYSSIPASQ